MYLTEVASAWQIVWIGEVVLRHLTIPGEDSVTDVEVAQAARPEQVLAISCITSLHHTYKVQSEFHKSKIQTLQCRHHTVDKGSARMVTLGNLSTCMNMMDLCMRSMRLYLLQESPCLVYVQDQ